VTHLAAKLAATCTKCQAAPPTDRTNTCEACRQAENRRVAAYKAEKRAALRAQHRCVDCGCRSARSALSLRTAFCALALRGHNCREIALRSRRPVFDVATVRETPIWDHLISARIERYRREVWYVPVGPLACPIGKPGDQLDARYVFDGMER
jgi:hypothetical protein